MKKWITLEEYSHRYKVSLSLLRRKIHLNQIDYIFHSGNYRIKNLPLYEQHPFRVDKNQPLKPIDQIEDRIRDLTLLLDKKTKQLQEVQSSYKDLKNLCQWLEKENKELKNLLLDFKKMENWLGHPQP